MQLTDVILNSPEFKTKKPVIDLKEAAGMLGVASVTLRRWLKDGHFPHSRLKRGKKIRFFRDLFINECVVEKSKPSSAR